MDNEYREYKKNQMKENKKKIEEEEALENATKDKDADKRKTEDPGDDSLEPPSKSNKDKTKKNEKLEKDS